MKRISKGQLNDYRKIFVAWLKYNLKAIILLLVCATLIVVAVSITNNRKNSLINEDEQSFKEVIETDYYRYTLNSGKDGYVLSLNRNFKAALEKNTQYDSKNGTLWTPETPLPNPGAFCDGIPIVSMKGAFEDCSTILRLDLSLWDTSNVVTLDSMFSGCSALTILDISGFDTSKVKSRKDMFSGCSDLKSLLVKNENNKAFAQTAIESYSESCKVTDLTAIRWVALGDSITEGYYSLKNGTYSKSNTMGWVTHVAASTGMKLDNKAVAGTGFVDTKAKYDITNGRTIVNDIDFSNYDLVTISYGMNDFRNLAKLGTFDDDVKVGGTVYSNMRYMIEKILKDNPDCEIVLITPLNCLGYGDYDSNWALGYQPQSGRAGMVDIFNALKEACEYYNLKMIDMTYNSFINRNNIQNYLLDNLHPTVDGYKILAEELAHKIKFLF